MTAAVIAALGSGIADVIARVRSGDRAAIADSRGAYACTTIAPIREEPAFQALVTA